MTPNHTTENDLQQYALDKANCDAGITEHINNCPACQTEAAMYTQLFAAIKDQPKPVFEFDIATIVTDQLPVQTTVVKHTGTWFNALIAAAVAFAAVPLWLFRQSLLNVVGNLSSLCLYGIAAASLVVLLYRLVNMYKLYQKKIDSLNFY